MSALNVLCAQLTRDLFAIAKFLYITVLGRDTCGSVRHVEWSDLFQIKTKCSFDGSSIAVMYVEG